VIIGQNTLNLNFRQFIPLSAKSEVKFSLIHPKPAKNHCNIQIKYSGRQTASIHTLTMPHPTKKSAHAKAQRHDGDQHFTTAKYSDSASEYATSAEHSSSSEAEEPAVLPSSKLSQKSRKRKLKSTYTGDSRRSQFRKQKYWQTAKQGCGTLSN
jgi:hypothetical protein